MASISPTTLWEEPDAKRATSRGMLGYPSLDAAGHWFISADPNDQEGTFTLLDGRLFLDPGVVAGGRLILLGNRKTVAFFGLPDSTSLSFYSPGLSLTAARTGAAAYLET